MSLMSNCVLAEIFSRIKNSKHFSISMDSTPDETHVDQSTLIFRGVKKSSGVTTDFYSKRWT